jgi:molybdate transport system substrate-binding protein
MNDNTPLRVLSAGAVRSALEEIAAEFTRATGTRLDIAFNTVGAHKKNLAAGEKADVIILSASAIGELELAGSLAAGSRADLGRVVTGVAMREGAKPPDLSTTEAFKRALIAAGAVSYSDPKSGGSSGIYVAGLLERLGVADAVNRKAVLRDGGIDVSKAVANGEAEIGITFITEILPVQGVKLAGLLPADIQNANDYAAAVAAASGRREAAQAFVRALATPAARARLKAAGFE